MKATHFSLFSLRFFPLALCEGGERKAKERERGRERERKREKEREKERGRERGR